jgi:hypothetical protein
MEGGRIVGPKGGFGGTRVGVDMAGAKAFDVGLLATMTTACGFVWKGWWHRRKAIGPSRRSDCVSVYFDERDCRMASHESEASKLAKLVKIMLPQLLHAV